MKKQLLLTALLISLACGLAARRHQGIPSQQPVIDNAFNPTLKVILEREFKTGASTLITALQQEGYAAPARRIENLRKCLIARSQRPPAEIKKELEEEKGWFLKDQEQIIQAIKERIKSYEHEKNLKKTTGDPTSYFYVTTKKEEQFYPDDSMRNHLEVLLVKALKDKAYLQGDGGYKVALLNIRFDFFSQFADSLDAASISTGTRLELFNIFLKTPDTTLKDRPHEKLPSPDEPSDEFNGRRLYFSDSKENPLGPVELTVSLVQNEKFFEAFEKWLLA